MFGRVFAGVLVAGLALTITTAAQLVTFTGGEPALASEINGNFTQLKQWLEQKVGTAGTARITANGGLDVNGLFTTGSITMDNDADITGTDVIAGYNDPRLRGDLTATNGSYDLLITAGGAVEVAQSLRVGTTLGIEGDAFGSYAPRNWGTSYTESSNGFVVAYLHADTNGDRCDMTATVGGSIVALDAATITLPATPMFGLAA